MADVRCPMCGKPNPAEAEVCRYCQARLKPLSTGSGSPPTVGKPQPPASPSPIPAPSQPAASQDSTDWLRGLLEPADASTEPAEGSPEAPAEPADDADAPNWLSRIRQRKTEETDAVSRIGPKPQVDGSENQPPQADDSNWLSGLTGQEGVSSSDAGDVASWLASLRDSDESKPPSQPASPAPKPAAPASAEDDEWLRSLTGRIQGSQLSDDILAQQNANASKAVPPAAQSASNEVPSSLEDELPDWLRNLGTGEPEPPAPAKPPVAKTPASPAPAPSETEPPDWLTQLGSSSLESSEAEPAEVPGWLKDLQPPAPSQPAQSAAPAASSSDEDIPDWLRDFSAEPPAAAKPPAAGSTADPSNEFPASSWDSIPSSSGDAAASSSGDETPASSTGELPDWMSHFASASSADEIQPPSAGESETGAAPADDIPEWLRDMRPAEPSAPASASVPASSDEEVPAWLQDFHTGQQSPDLSQGAIPSSSQDAVPSSLGEELPDWLKDLQGTETPSTSEVAPQEPSAEPNWHSQFSAPPEEPSAPPASSEASQTITPLGIDEPPDWLSQLGASAEPEAPAQPAAEEHIPDWLSDFRGIPAATAAGLPAVDSTSQPPAVPASSGGEVSGLSEDKGIAPGGEETPDWLKDFDTLPPVSQAAEQQVASSDDTVRDWLNSLNAPETSQGSAPSALEGIAPEDLAPAEIPDWLKSVRDQAPSQQKAPPPASSTQAAGGAASPFGDEALPDWMNTQQPAEAGWETPAAPETSRQPFASHEMNEILSGVPTDASTARETAVEAGGEALEPAQLPNWLQAMRPVESAVSDISPISAADDQRVEKSGPLAGLRGVLPGEEMVSQYRKPPVYTNKLQVSEKQRLHSSLLENILSDESKAQAVPGESIQASQLILRLLVAVLLIALVLVPALTGFTLPVPANLASSQAGVENAFVNLNSLPNGANVLLVADYEAGLSGELKAAAQPVLSQLRSRQPNLFLASTVPSGQVLAEGLLTTNSKEWLINPVANLGYIPGGTNGLRRLAQHASGSSPAPLQQVVPFPYFTSAPYQRDWNDPAVQGLKDITSFQAILVVTDSLENARAWIEQVQPGLGAQTQLVLISSAQVAPLVQTYLENKQVQGVVSGLTGGTAYDQLSKPGTTSATWTAYQLLLAAMIVLIIAGALAAGVSSLFGRGKSKRKV